MQRTIQKNADGKWGWYVHDDDDEPTFQPLEQLLDTFDNTLLYVTTERPPHMWQEFVVSWKRAYFPTTTSLRFNLKEEADLFAMMKRVRGSRNVRVTVKKHYEEDKGYW